VTKADEKLAGADQTLAELGTSDEEIFAVRSRFVDAEPMDLDAIDGQLQALSEGIPSLPVTTAPRAVEPGEPEEASDTWDDESTEVEVLDESDFVLLVNEEDLEELEKAGEEAPRVSCPPPVPQTDEEGDGFFKKLFGSRRSSNRP